jgi:hypothetical protein
MVGACMGRWPTDGLHITLQCMHAQLRRTNRCRLILRRSATAARAMHRSIATEPPITTAATVLPLIWPLASVDRGSLASVDRGSTCSVGTLFIGSARLIDKHQRTKSDTWPPYTDHFGVWTTARLPERVQVMQASKAVVWFGCKLWLNACAGVAYLQLRNHKLARTPERVTS